MHLAWSAVRRCRLTRVIPVAPVDHDRLGVCIWAPHGSCDWRRRYACRDLNAEQLLRMGGSSHWIYASQ